MVKTVGYKILPVIILSVALNACELINRTANNPTFPQNSPLLPQSQTIVVTKAQYNQVQQNMALSEVERIIGKPGQSADSSFSIPGTENKPAFGSKQTYYQWGNSDGSAMVAVFVDDKLVFKSQVNLK
ncbi:MAG: hypothetical protein KME60_31320 [Cyanomargarita calcarea GSE-NOS-MK-12-04C]|jgi:hypothetical protein|uniref:Lipoprotein SmpA/OmlA domain-containing protein n=1 Tax=Cyanomargarita calcarea GSE-NOS-MK-12-04C TaxID=2839659 RepID=A0A951QTF9_9CYAN|nr:hypothetical protein [Cyanomargarita calcarea GSE-NOS-MK-12-04C]